MRKQNTIHPVLANLVTYHYLNIDAQKTLFDRLPTLQNVLMFIDIEEPENEEAPGLLRLFSNRRCVRFPDLKKIRDSRTPNKLNSRLRRNNLPCLATVDRQSYRTMKYFGSI